MQIFWRTEKWVCSQTQKPFHKKFSERRRSAAEPERNGAEKRFLWKGFWVTHPFFVRQKFAVLALKDPMFSHFLHFCLGVWGIVLQVQLAKVNSLFFDTSQQKWKLWWEHTKKSKTLVRTHKNSCSHQPFFLYHFTFQVTVGSKNTKKAMFFDSVCNFKSADDLFERDESRKRSSLLRRMLNVKLGSRWNN